MFRAILKIIRDPRFVIVCLVIGLIIFFSGIIIDFLVATLTQGYNIIRDFISDLGTHQYTPLPFLFNDSLMLAALLFLPTILYAQKRFGLFPTHHERLSKTSQIRTFLSAAGYIFTIMGILGFFGVGLFYEGSEPKYHLHNIFAGFSFVGFISAGIFFGFLIFLHPTPIPKVIGVFMVFIPPVFGFLYFYDVSPSQLFEWLTFISILGWLIPCALIFLVQLEREVHFPLKQDSNRQLMAQLKLHSKKSKKETT